MNGLSKGIEVPRIEVPQFGIGEVDQRVDEYGISAIERVCTRNCIDGPEKERLLTVFMAALSVCKKKLPETLLDAQTTALPEGRELWRVCGQLFVGEGSQLHGKEHLDSAFELLERGDNVLLVSNHTSGADTLVMEALTERVYGEDVLRDMAYMSGHAVNLYLFPYLMTSGLRRFQIFSRKYKSMAVSGSGIVQDTGAGEAAMNAQNMRSLRALGKHTSSGGKMIGLYPEGGRGEGCLKDGEPDTVCVAEIIARSGKPLHILPVYVSGATNILPVNRTDNEYNEFFEHIGIADASIRFGKIVSWSSLSTLASTSDLVRTKALQHLPFATETEKCIVKGSKIACIMSLIADLAPKTSLRGVYAHETFGKIAARLTEM